MLEPYVALATTAPRNRRAFLLVAAAACTSPRGAHNAVDTAAMPIPEGSGLPGVTFDADGLPGPLPDDFLVTYSQTLCFGWCPAFQVTIDRDGFGTYTGQGCVQNLGPVRTWVAPDDLRDIVVALGALRFASLDERYAALEPRFTETTDMPSVTLTVRSAGTLTTVDDYLGNASLYAWPPTSDPWLVPIVPLPAWFSTLRDLEGYVFDVTGVADPIGDPHLVPGCGI